MSFSRGSKATKTTEATPTYLVDDPCFPYCKGCGHTRALRALDEALVGLQLDPAQVDITTDIGCVGLADALFKNVHTVHTTHGRSTAFAVGTVIADRILADGKLKAVVMIGDGGAMIGLLHIVQAAQMNVDVTVLLHNNFLFGMTGGQHSAFTPTGFVTTTTLQGNITPPLDICQIAQSCGAGFVARKFATDRDLAATVAEAIAYPGFALIEVVGLCTAYGPRLNKLSGRRLKEIVEGQGHRTGMLLHWRDRKEFALMYEEKFPRRDVSPAEDFIPIKFNHGLKRPVGLIISGTAGERVQSSARLFCQAAVMCGLHTTQKNDNLVTQGTGFSLSEACLSPSPILYTGIDSAAGIIIVSDDGWREVKGRGDLDRLDPDGLLIIDSELPQPKSRAKVVSLPFRRLVSGEMAAAAALGLWLKISRPFPVEAYVAALKNFYGDHADNYVEALDKVLGQTIG